MRAYPSLSQIYWQSGQPDHLISLACRIKAQEWLLGGAAVVILAGVAATVLQRPKRVPRALPATASQIDAEDRALTSTAVSESQNDASPAAEPDVQQQANWWEQREIFIVADQGDGQNPATAGPILFQAAGKAILPSFQDQVTAETFANALRAWDRSGDGAFGHRTVTHTGQFHVVMLSPADLNVGNVPDIVLVPPPLLSSEALASADAWRAAVAAVALPQLDAWQKHVTQSTAAPAQQPAAQEPPATQPRDEDVSRAGPQADEANPGAPPQQTREQTAPRAVDGTAATRPPDTPLGPPPPPPAPPNAGSARASSTARGDPVATDPAQPSSSEREQSGGPAVSSAESQVEPTSSPTATAPRSSAAAEPPPAMAGPPMPPAATADTQAAEAAPARPAPQAAPPAGPKVYASVADLEADRPWDVAAAGGGDRDVPGSVPEPSEPQEELRLLSAEETDASAVHTDPGSLKAVFTPILMRKGLGGPGDADEDRMMFTVDATLDQGDPDVVALAFEDPVDANALLAMLAHVQGFTDKDGVVRRVVPMPPGAAMDAAVAQGASLLCMARGFQVKANVRAGRDINGVLSRIAGARWAALMAQHQAVHH